MDWIHDNCDKDGEPGITFTSFKHYLNSQDLTCRSTLVALLPSCSVGNSKALAALIGNKVPKDQWEDMIC